LGDRRDLAAKLLARGRDFLQFGGVAGAEHDVGAGAGEHLRRQRAERAGGAGDDRGFAADVEQRERILQKVLGHDLRPMSLLGSASPRLREGVSSAPCLHHFCGVDTATSMVTTSLPRLTISRLSFGPMKQASLALSTVCLPPAMRVSSPAST